MLLAALLLPSLLFCPSSNAAGKFPVLTYKAKMVSNAAWVSLGFYSGASNFGSCSSRCDSVSGCGSFAFDATSSSCELGGKLNLPADEVASGGKVVFASKKLSFIMHNIRGKVIYFTVISTHALFATRTDFLQRPAVLKNINIINCIKGDNYSRVLGPTIEIIYGAEDKQKGTVWLLRNVDSTPKRISAAEV